MKKKLFMLLALVCMTLTASAYDLTVGTSEHGAITFKVSGNTVTSADEGQKVEVVISPATGYVVNQPSGTWYAAVAGARRNAPANIDLLKDIDLTPAGENSWTFTMKRANVEISATYKKLLTNTDITVEDIAALTYTGEAQTPTVTVKDGSTTLVLNTDYTVTYSNNTDAALATATQNAPTVTITAVATSEKYSGTVTKTFTINPATLTAATLAETSFTYDGKAKTPAVTVKFGETTLEENTDYTLAYSDNVNAGTATVTATGKGNYTGTKSATYTILKKLLTITADNKTVTYGDPAPEYTVSYDGFVNNENETVLGGTLALDCDYIEYQSDAGTYDITPSGLTSSNYAITFINGTLSVYQASLTSITIDPASLVYNREEQTVNVTGVSAGYLPVDLSDCTVTGNSGTDAGTYTVTVTANDNSINFYGSASADFTISPKPISDGMVAVESGTFTGEPLTPTVTVTDGNAVLAEGTEYSVSYSNNTAIGDASVTVSGMGNYTGSVTSTFFIVPNLPQVDVEASEDNKNDEEVDGVKMDMDVTDYSAITREERTIEDPETGEEVTKEVYVVPVQLSEITIPEQEEPVNPETGKTEKAEMTVYIPGSFVSDDGSTVFEVVRIGANAIKSDTETAIVSTIVLPETEKPIEVQPHALDVDNLPADDPNHRTASILTPLRFLDDYALMSSLKENYENEQVSAIAQAVNHFWTFSCGVDVKRPAGVRMFICKASDDESVTISELHDDVIKANNGVLVACANGDGNAYDMVAQPSAERPSGSVPVTSNAMSYPGNLLIPVIEDEHFAPSSIYIMSNNEFHELSATDNTNVPANKAVMPRTSASQARTLNITVGGSDTTGIGAVEFLYGEGEKSQWYDLKGHRISRPTRKGVYIMNGHKVTVK